MIQAAAPLAVRTPRPSHQSPTISADRCPTPSWSRVARRRRLPGGDAVAQMKGLATPLHVKPSGMPPRLRRVLTVLDNVLSQASSTGGTSVEPACPPTSGPPPGRSAADLRGARGLECAARGLPEPCGALPSEGGRRSMRQWEPSSRREDVPADDPGGPLGDTPRPSPVCALAPLHPSASNNRWARTGGPGGPFG